MRSLALAVALLIASLSASLASSVALGRPTQPKQLAALPSAAQARKQFARDAGHVRVLIVASPTCPACRRGVAAVVRDVLGGVTAKELRAYVVWVPMIDGDTAEAARLEASLYPDKRISHYWDGDKQLASELGVTLGLADGKPAWDVYLAYDRRAKWASAPSLWMHQLDGVTLAPWLDAAKLRGKIEELLR